MQLNWRIFTKFEVKRANFPDRICKKKYRKGKFISIANAEIKKANKNRIHGKVNWDEIYLSHLKNRNYITLLEILSSHVELFSWATADSSKNKRSPGIKKSNYS